MKRETTAKSSILYPSAETIKFLDAINAIVVSLDKDGKISFINKAGRNLLGYTKKELLGKDWFKQAIPAEARKEIKGVFRKLMGGKMSFVKVYDNEVVTKSGKRKIVSWHNTLLKDKSGKIIGTLSAGTDITEKQEIQQKHRQGEATLRQMAETIKGCFWITRWSDKQTIYATKGFEKIWGRKLEDLYKKKNLWAQAIYPKDRTKALQNFINLGKGQSYSEEYRIRRPDKSIRWVRDQGYPVKDNQGEVKRVVGLAQDITKEKEAEEKLKLSEAKLESIISSTPDLTFVFNKKLDFGEYYCPPEMEKTLYLPPKKFLGKNINDIFPKELREVVVPPLLEAMQKEICTSFDYEIPIRGEIRYYAARACPRRDARGRVCGVTVVSRDISQRINAEENMRKFQLAAEGASDHIVITDIDGKIIFANQAAEENTGYSRKEMIGKNPSLWGQQMPVEFYKKLWRTIKIEKKPFSGEVKNKGKDGRLYDAEIRLSPILGDKDEIIYFLGIERDITREKEIDRAKTEFVSLASHELRGPLTAINWYTEMLLGSKEDLSPRCNKYLQEIKAGGRRMVKLVNALLNVSRIELGTFTIKPELSSVTAIIDQILKTRQSKIKGRGLQITKSYQKHIPKVKIDPALIRTIMSNVISNAIKYTPAGGKISIEVSKKGKDIVFKVIDSGCGIPANQQHRVFEKLFRADNAVSIDPEGHGLGLYIVKSILDQAGGKIWFESALNQGSTFYVSIPVSGMKPQAGKKELT